VYLFGSPFSLCRRKWGWPWRYSKTVALAKPTVSRSKRKSDAAALLDRRTRATKAPSCQKSAAVRELLGITSKGVGSFSLQRFAVRLVNANESPDKVYVFLISKGALKRRPG